MRKCAPAQPNHAFSLVELSIVLVIIGLLVGGVLVGQSLVRAAELRSVYTDFARFKNAFSAFQDKYSAIPGDIETATNYWGTAAGSGADNTCYAFASTGTATCNGNGNGQINWAVGANNFGEMHRAWQHLANAGMIEGHYSGVDTGPVLGTTSPKNKIANTGFEMVYSTNGGAFGESFSSLSDGHILFYGTAAGGITRGVALKPIDAANIDGKIDDGKPDTGKLQTDTSYSASCFTGGYPNAAYVQSGSSPLCSLRYQLQ